MEFRQLGSSGLRISAVGLGCNPFGNEVDPEGADAIVSTAIDAGVTYFDTADTYFDGRSEEYLGRALKGKRDKVIVATKVGNRSGPGPNDTGTSRKRLVQACEDSLRRLQVDYIDVYQIHTPDRSTPIEETMRALDDLVRQGKVRYIGASNFFEWEVAEAQWVAKTQNLTPFVSCQDFYNLLYRDIEKRMEPFCKKYGLAMIPYFPLAGGLLSGAYKRGDAPAPGSRGAIRPTFKTWDSDRNWHVQEALSAFAANHGWTLPQLSIAWLLTRPMMATVIAGADAPEHIASNVKALDVKLAPEDLEEIDRITLVDEDRTIAPIYQLTRPDRASR
jgi:aryl-alcohol dehydrogenase-like predicted oxidoreductase